MGAEAEAARVQVGLQGLGWAHLGAFQVEDDGGAALLGMARSLGRLYLAPGREAAEPLLHTRASAQASPWEPYNQLDRIGWHGDFCTVEVRPRLSLVWARVVPTEEPGDWGVVSWEQLRPRLEASLPGQRALELFAREPLPFCYAPRTPVRWAPVLEPWGLRFDGRALRLGLAQHPVAGALEAVAALEAAADALSRRIPVAPGDLLVCDNRRALHDRRAQAPGRQVVLAFVS